MNSRSYCRAQQGAGPPVNSRAKLVSTTKQSGATLRCGASRRVRLLGVTLAALICAIGLTGCGPPLTLKVVGSGVAFEGGYCVLDVDVSGLSNGYRIGIGMFKTSQPASPVYLGVLTANSAGVINDGPVTYKTYTPPERISDLNVGVYDVTPAPGGGWQLDGAALTSVTVNIKVCVPTGLAEPQL